MTDHRADPSIRAAGAVLWRAVEGVIEVGLIHRPRYDDWSLPKGKLDRGETEAQAAMRELEEETGHAGLLGAYLGVVEYIVVRKGTEHPKTVHYWEVEARAGTFAPSDEVDALRWLSIGDAGPLLTQERDRGVLDQFADVVRLRAAEVVPE